MANNKVIRVMEPKDLFYVYGARKMYEEYGHHGDYFFFVIEDIREEIIGYLIAKKEGKKAVILDLQITEEISDKKFYEKAATAELYEYVRNIKGCNGESTIYQVALY